MNKVFNSHSNIQWMYTQLLHHPKPIVFDIDEVLFDARHRQHWNPDGSLCLKHYRRNSTLDKVLEDKPLPFLDLFKMLLKARSDLHLCTARVVTDGMTEKLMEKHGIFNVPLLGRQSDQDHRPDSLLKMQECTLAGIPRFMLVDDRRENCMEAIRYNNDAIHVLTGYANR